MSEVKKLKGQNGMILLYEDSLAISKKTFGGFVSQGGAVSGERRFFFQDIASIEYKKPGWTNGYIKIITAGSVETNAKVGLFKTSSNSMKDQNTLVLMALTKSKANKIDDFYNMIMARMLNAKTAKSAAPQVSKMDELKKLSELRDSGVLSEKEFQKEKAKILNS